MAEDADARALRILAAIHEAIAAHNVGVACEWPKELAFHNRPPSPEEHDPVAEAIEAVKNGNTVYVIGGGGIIRVDSRTGNVIDGASQAGVSHIDY